MSADNWTYCPKCHAADEAKSVANQKQVAESYGKVAAEEYLKRVAALTTKPERDETLREDYEIGIYKGEFSVSYSASCSVCKFSHSFKHKKKVC